MTKLPHKEPTYVTVGNNGNPPIQSFDLTNLPDDKGQNETKTVWKEVHGIRLHETHRQILSMSQWLDDDIITVCQHLLKEHHPLVGGLQPVVLAEKFAMQPESGKFVQILNAGRSHWMTVSTIGCAPGEINIYNSLHLKLSSTNKKVVSDLMRYTRARQ